VRYTVRFNAQHHMQSSELMAGSLHCTDDTHLATQGSEVTSYAVPPAYKHPSFSASVASTPVAVPAGWEAILGSEHGRTMHGMTRCDFTLDSRSSASTSDAAAAGMTMRGARALRSDEDAVEALETALDALHKNQVRLHHTPLAISRLRTALGSLVACSSNDAVSAAKVPN
jgi:hypothetical protein